MDNKMQTWLCADWHLGEERLKIIGRPFSSTEEMHNVLIANHNALVASQDRVIVVGDVCRKPEFLGLMAQFNGVKTLVRGNHDRQISDADFKKYFELIISDGEGLEITAESPEGKAVHCYVTHYPTRGKLNLFNLVAHVHTAWKYQLNSLNVGVDVHHYRPINLSCIPFHLTAICEYYDEDVWVGYNKINVAYKDIRGKKGSYFVVKS
jgi:calcineurin-like phosphoesterase family protein